jgi:hypothetical protein
LAHIQSKGVKVALGDAAAAFERGAGGKGLVAKTKGGKEYPADMAMLVIGESRQDSLCGNERLLGCRERGPDSQQYKSEGASPRASPNAAAPPAADRSRMPSRAYEAPANQPFRTAPGHPRPAPPAPLRRAGVRPEATLARDAGLEIGARGGVRVDEHMRTSDPAIYAVGAGARGAGPPPAGAGAQRPAYNGPRSARRRGAKLCPEPADCGRRGHCLAPARPRGPAAPCGRMQPPLHFPQFSPLLAQPPLSPSPPLFQPRPPLFRPRPPSRRRRGDARLGHWRVDAVRAGWARQPPGGGQGVLWGCDGGYVRARAAKAAHLLAEGRPLCLTMSALRPLHAHPRTAAPFTPTPAPYLPPPGPYRCR